MPAFANPLLASLLLPQVGGRVVVDGHLEVTGAANVRAAGDAARIPNGAGGEFAPPTAQRATREAVVLSFNAAQIPRASATRCRVSGWFSSALPNPGTAPAATAFCCHSA